MAQLELGRVRLLQNANAEAQEILRALREECAQTLGDDDVLTIDVLHFLGVSLGEQERFDEAREAFDFARASALDALGEGHEPAIQALHSQAILRASRARAAHTMPDEETSQLFEAVLEASRELHGSDDPRRVRRITDRASIPTRRGQLDPALDLYDEAFERSHRVQDPTHPTTATALHGLGVPYFADGNLEEACRVAEKAFEIIHPLGGSHSLYEMSATDFAFYLAQQGREDEAWDVALRGYEELESHGSPSAMVADLLAEPSTRAGDPEGPPAGGASRPTASTETTLRPLPPARRPPRRGVWQRPCSRRLETSRDPGLGAPR